MSSISYSICVWGGKLFAALFGYNTSSAVGILSFSASTYACHLLVLLGKQVFALLL